MNQATQMDQQAQQRPESLDEKLIKRLGELQIYIRRYVSEIKRRSSSVNYATGGMTDAERDAMAVEVEMFESMVGRYDLELKHLAELKDELQARMKFENLEAMGRSFVRSAGNNPPASPSGQVSENLEVVRADLKSAHELCQTFLMQEDSKFFGSERQLLQKQDLAIRMMVAAMEEVRAF